MEEHHAKFGLFKDKYFPPSLFAYRGCNVVVSDEFVKSFDVCPYDPRSLHCESTKSQGVDCANVYLVVHFPPSIAKDESYATSEGSIRDYCKFARLLLLSLPLLDMLEYDFDLGIELGSGSS